jgi:hypothetical protein
LRTTVFMTSTICSTLGAATRMPRQRLRTGSMILDGLLQIRISRQAVEYLKPKA